MVGTHDDQELRITNRYRSCECVWWHLGVGGRTIDLIKRHGQEAPRTAVLLVQDSESVNERWYPHT